ncbi:MAG: hypothetical protein ACLUHA_15190 [Bacteroides stercoris]
MNSGYHKNLVFTAACIGMCFFGVSMITLGSVLPSLVTKLELSGLQTTFTSVTFLPIGHALVGFLVDFRSYGGPLRTQSIVGSPVASSYYRGSEVTA